MRILITICLLILQVSFAVAAEPQDKEAARFTRALDRGFRGLDFESEGAWREPFFFLQMADTQYGMFTKDMGFEKEAELAAKAVEHINRLKPRFVIVCGDLTNATPDHARYKAQVGQFKADFSKVSPDIPLVCVCGNHDIGNRPNAASIASYGENFGDDYFGFWVGGVCNLVLNSTIIKDSTGAESEYKQQDKWFRENLIAAREKKATHIMVFQHHPWFLKTADEPDEYFNLPLPRRKLALEAMTKSGVRAIFAGHYHRNSYGKAGDIEMITTGPVGRPLGKDPSGFRVVRVFQDRIDHQYYGMESIPASVSMAGSSQERPLGIIGK
jgi:serine/threonine-protein phosphatase CPPED1